MRRFVIFALATAVLVGASAAALAAQMQTLEAKVSPARKSKSAKRPRGVSIFVRTVTSTPDGSKPSPGTRTVIFLQKGFGYASVSNPKAFPTCSRQKLEQQGPSACPAKSKVGTGTAQVDARPVVNEPINATVTAFNGANRTLLLYGQVTQPIQTSTTLQGRLKKVTGRDAKTYEYKLDVPVPPLPTLPGQPNASLTQFQLTTKASVRKGGKRIDYITAPTVCKKRWMFKGVFTYEDGTQNTVVSRQPCK